MTESVGHRINCIQSKLSRSIAVLNKAKQVLDQKSRHMLYWSLVTIFNLLCWDLGT